MIKHLNLQFPLKNLKLPITPSPLWKRGQGGFKQISGGSNNLQSYKNPPQSSFVKGGSLRNRNTKLLKFLIPALFLFNSCSLDMGGLIYSSYNIHTRAEDNKNTSSSDLSFTDTEYSFIVISDIHINGKENPAFDSLKPKLAKTDKFIVMAGDLSQNGNKSDFDICKTQVQSLGLPYYATAGNHDLYYAGWPNYKEVFGQSYYSFATHNMKILMADTANGTLGRAQRQWMEGALNSKEKTLCTVITHMNIFPSPNWDVFQLTNIEESYSLMDLFAKKNVNYAIMGHTHASDTWEINKVKYCNIDNFANGKQFLRVTVKNSAVSHEYIKL